MSELFTVKLACEKCDRYLVLTVGIPTVLKSFRCPCGHETIVRDFPALPVNLSSKPGAHA
jgi:hypothetical protein